MAKNNSNRNNFNNSDPNSDPAGSFSGSAVPVPDLSDLVSGDEVIPTLEIPGLGAPANSEDETHGQFSGDDLEFESWMFDAGDGKGIVAPQDSGPLPVHASQDADISTDAGLSTLATREADPSTVSMAPTDGTPAVNEEVMAPRMDAEQPQDVVQAEPAPPTINSQGVPVPEFSNAFSTDQEVSTESSALDMLYESTQSQGMPAWLDNPPVYAAQIPIPPVEREPQPASPSAWSDQMLASVDDFSSVLLSLRSGTTHAGSPDFAPLSQAPVAEAMPVAPTQVEPVAPLWQTRDAQASLVPAPVEVPAPPATTADADEAYQASANAAPVDVLIEAPQPPLAPSLSWGAGVAAPLGAPDVASAEDMGMLASAEGHAPDAAWPSFEAIQEEAAGDLPPWLDEQAAALEAQPQPAEAAMSAPPEAYPAVEVPDLASLGADEPAPIVPATANMPELDSIGVEPVQATESEAGADAAWVADVSTAPEPVEAQAHVEPGMATEATASQSEATGLPGMPEGGISGEDLEFESWMFNEGAMASLPELPNSESFAPVVSSIEDGLQAVASPPNPALEGESPALFEANLHADAQVQAEAQAAHLRMESVAEPTQAVEEDGPLPFWLQDGMESGFLSGSLPALEGQSFPSTTLEAGMISEPDEFAEAAPVVQAQAKESSADDLNFSDLPPIEPFDFSLLQEPEQEEELGFRTEELTGVPGQGNDPMMVTANLDVLADLLGKDRAPGESESGQASQEAGNQIMNRLMVPETQSRPAQEPAPEAPRRTPGWTATETSKLSSETLTNLVNPPDVDELSTSYVDRTDNLTQQDMGVSPFDMSSFEFASDEEGTGFLSSGDVGRASAEQVSKIFTGTLFTEPNLQNPEYWEAPDWMSSMSEPSTDGSERPDMDTSRFSAGNRPDSDDALSTQLIGRSSANPVSQEAPADDGSVGIFRARVSRFKVNDDLYRRAEVTSGAHAGRSPEPQYAYSGPLHEAAPRQQVESISTSPQGITTTGPLAPPKGFEALQQMVAARPNEHGAHLALAVAYAQAGHTEHALDEYHHLLQKRDIPAPLLGMIESQVSDLALEAGGSPRFHQVLGDVLMKQGRYNEAIEEYNNIK